jgi:hypothetical protein
MAFVMLLSIAQHKATTTEIVQSPLNAMRLSPLKTASALAPALHRWAMVAAMPTSTAQNTATMKAIAAPPEP